jgi:hypothetical protein
MPPAIRIDFSRPIALFPLPAVIVFPHTAEWLVAFEARYRQLVEDCLRARTDGNILTAAPFAMATYATRQWTGERIGEPALRPAVCVVKIVDHRPLSDGRHQILMHGITRATIDSIAEPDGRRLYRLARLRPIDTRVGGPRRMPALEAAIGRLLNAGELARLPRLEQVRGWIRQGNVPPRRMPALEAAIGRLLNAGELARLPRLEQVRGWIRQGNVPTDVLVEQLNDFLSRRDEVRYRLLAEPSGRLRARNALSELRHLSDLLAHAEERTASPKSRGITLN